MQAKEMVKKLADNYETLVMVMNRHPSSMSRLKNLLIAEGVSETSARRKIADLDTELGCMVVEEYGTLKLNQKLISQMIMQIQSELKIPNYFEEEYKAKVVALEHKIGQLEQGNMKELDALKSENKKKDEVIENLKRDAEEQNASYEWSRRFDRDRYLEVSGKLKMAEEKITRMKKGIFSYFMVCWEDRRAARLEKKRIKREAKARQKHYEELERKWEKERKEKEKKKSSKQKGYVSVNKW